MQAYAVKRLLTFRPCAEIGDATVGSLASCTSKDSSLKAPGYFGALVATVTYVDHDGKACNPAGAFLQAK